MKTCLQKKILAGSRSTLSWAFARLHWPPLRANKCSHKKTKHTMAEFINLWPPAIWKLKMCKGQLQSESMSMHIWAYGYWNNFSLTDPGKARRKQKCSIRLEQVCKLSCCETLALNKCRDCVCNFGLCFVIFVSPSRTYIAGQKTILFCGIIIFCRTLRDTTDTKLKFPQFWFVYSDILTVICI